MMTSKLVFKTDKGSGKITILSLHLYNDGWTNVNWQLLIEECGNGCKGFFKEKLQKKIWIFVPGLLAITLIASLCIVVSVLHEKQKKHNMDCMLRPNLNSDSPITCLHVDKYPLSNEIYARMCQQYCTDRYKTVS